MADTIIPGPIRVASGGLRVATWNIHRAVGLDRRRDPARIAAVIGELGADIIGLQEVDWHDEPNGEPQFEYLAHLSGYAAVTGANLRDHRGHYGNLLLTRLPIRHVRHIDLSHGRREARGAIVARLGTAGAELRVIVTHLGLGLAERRAQAAQVRQLLLEPPQQPALLLGDFNDWLPTQPTLRCVTFLCQQQRSPPSWPAPWPVVALDRILTYGIPGGVRIVAHRSHLTARASDHLPIVATLPPLAQAADATAPTEMDGIAAEAALQRARRRAG